MDALDDLGKAAGRFVDAATETAAEASASVRFYLASEEGRHLRNRVAKVLIVGAPLVTRLPVIRRTPIGRIIGAAGVAALVVKGAEWLRDWEPTPPQVEIDRSRP